MAKQWVPSRYNRLVRLKGQGSMLYNSYTGAVAWVDPVEADEARTLLDREIISEAGPEWSSLAADMSEAGFLVPTGTDELLQAANLHQALKDASSMHLVIMPTEACNFRCTYCYQTFPRGAMSREIIDGLKAYVREAARRIDHLTVSWFGGEPLLAPDIVTELSDSFMESCQLHGVVYSADMSTNGYFLTRERCEELLRRNIQRFMITLDGIGEIHDKRRKHSNGGGTYDRIISNLLELREIAASFKVDLRVNFDEDNAGSVPELLERLSGAFAGDRRFQILIRPVGRWGGPQDSQIPVCDRTAADTHLWNLSENGLERGLTLSETIADSLLPSGSVCYAAKPNSLVIGANGRLYKCSIAFEEENNQIGRIHGDGTLEMDMRKMSLWTDGGEEQDSVCRSCFYRPACQGNHCPLYRMRTGKRPCPHEKRKIIRVLNLIWRNSEDRGGGDLGDESDSSGCFADSSSQER